MFTNIGRKIQMLAKVLCWIGIAASCIYGIIVIVSGTSISRYLGGGGSLVLAGVLIMLLGSLLSWVGSFVLFGFGELIERVKNIEGKLDNPAPSAPMPEAAPVPEVAGFENAFRTKAPEKVQSDVWYCRKCGHKNSNDYIFCVSCGEHK